MTWWVNVSELKTMKVHPNSFVRIRFNLVFGFKQLLNINIIIKMFSIRIIIIVVIIILNGIYIKLITFFLFRINRTI